MASRSISSNLRPLTEIRQGPVRVGEIMGYLLGDMVYSRVYGHGTVSKIIDVEHVAVEIPDDDEFVVHVSSLMKVGLA